MYFIRVPHYYDALSHLMILIRRPEHYKRAESARTFALVSGPADQPQTWQVSRLSQAMHVETINVRER
jgi:hypothetical protein